ncbi:MAG: TatD family hydrolase [Treponema sp.]|jgi:TatD DNase family protein|nr:TatD family hydrolase [Treponema sp.]
MSEAQFTDAHCHPFDLVRHFPAAEDERRRLGVICAASAATAEEFTYCEQLSRQAQPDYAALLPCYAVHPQMPAVMSVPELSLFNDQLAMLETLAVQKRIAAVGETGFDLYNAAFRETEHIQDALFVNHLETALRHDLPLVIHARRAMHKIFAYSDLLKKCRAVIFHSWPGTAGEGEALLRRGINAFFSFGNVIMLNHREAMRCCAVFPADRLLTETDAPFQPPRGEKKSGYADLQRILETMSALRREAAVREASVRETVDLNAAETKKIIEKNFRAAFNV